MYVSGISASFLNQSAAMMKKKKIAACIQSSFRRREAEVQEDPIMALYKEICGKHLDTTFRYETKESLNQVGKDFGEIFQKSVSIDDGVLKMALDDPAFKAEFMGVLENKLEVYSNYRISALDQGMSNLCINFLYEDGKLVECVTYLPSQFSTEEEIKDMKRKCS